MNIEDTSGLQSAQEERPSASPDGAGGASPWLAETARIEKLTTEELEELVQKLTGERCRRGEQLPSTELTERTILRLINTAAEHICSEPTLVEVELPATIYGDIHGQHDDLLSWMERVGPPSANHRCLFLGDYVDRGQQSIEVICLLLAYKALFPTRVCLLRGNHEWADVNRNYGFLSECTNRYSRALWRSFNEFFRCLPLAALVGQRMLCVHGGISPQLEKLDDIRQIDRLAMRNSGESSADGTPTLVVDLVWSDPAPSTSGYQDSHRGVSVEFGEDTVTAACRRLGVDLIVRAHQVVQDGYEFFADRRLVTIFSAPQYCHFDNAGAVMQVDADLVCSFCQLH